METEIFVPDEAPVMTLPGVTFFPQSLMPLHIFETRYRKMLKDVLATNRLFAVAGIDRKKADDPDQFEPIQRIASLGIIRACQDNDDGTSNLLLQGLCRVECISILTEEPYRRIRIQALTSESGGDPAENERLRLELQRLLALKKKFGAPIPKEMVTFLRGVEDPETLVDLAAFSLCESGSFKQKLLETLDIRQRLELFNARLRSEIDEIKLRRRLQGRLDDEHISDN